jgi:argininosuccinate synthase
MVAVKYAELTYNGLWFTPLREALDAFVNSTQGPITGLVRLKLYKGNIIITGRTSPYSLYREEFATFGHSPVYDHTDAAGFIRLFGLPLKVKAMMEMGNNDIPPVPVEKIVRD